MATKSGSGSPSRRTAVGKASKTPAGKATTAKATTATTGKATTAKATTATTAKATTGEATAADAAAQDTPETPERKPWPIRLYLGEIGYDFIGKRKIWYVVSAVLILICLGSMIFKGFNLGVEFAGGERFRSPGTAQQLDELSQAVEDVGADVTSAQAVGDNQLVLITADLDEERSREVSAAIARLSRELGRSPSPHEVADAVGATLEETLEAMETGMAYDAVSLDGPRGGDGEQGDSYAETIGAEDSSYELVEYRDAALAALRTLPQRERLILRLRFFEGLTQAQIGERLGISQMHVSRLKRRALAQLHAQEEAAA